MLINHHCIGKYHRNNGECNGPIAQPLHPGCADASLSILFRRKIEIIKRQGPYIRSCHGWK